jgi:hypothetical protein
MSVEVTPINVTDLYTTINQTAAAAATSSVINTDEIFYFVVPDGRRAIQRILVEVTEANNAGNIVATVKAGDQWAAKDETVTCTDNKVTFFMIESAKHLIKDTGNAEGSDDKEIQVTLTPASGQRLYTDHGATVRVYLLY